MAAVTATHKGEDIGNMIFEANRNRVRRFKPVLITLADTVDNADTVEVTLANYGLSDTGLLIVRGVTHTTVNSVLVIEAPTTAVSAGVLTITVGGSTANKARSFLIIGEER